MNKNDDIYKQTHSLENIKNNIDKAVNNVTSLIVNGANKIEKISEELYENLTDLSEKAEDDILSAETVGQEKIISAQSRYAEEKIRIEKKRKEESEALKRAEFQEKLAAAKDSEKAAKLIREENFRLEKLADDEYLAELKDAAEKEKIIRESEFSHLKNSLDIGYITQEEYYSRLAELRDKYFDQDSNEWAKYTKEINEYQTDSLNDLKDFIKSSEEEFESLKEKAEKKLSDYTNPYKKRTATYKKMGPFGSDFEITTFSLSDLSKGTEKIHEYTDMIKAVKNRKEVPEFLIDELKDMDIDDGMKFAKMLLEVPDYELEKYIDSYKEMQNEIAQFTSEFTADEAADMINTISAELEKYYDIIPEGFFESGRLSGENFTSAFLAELDELADGLNNIFSYSGGFSQSSQPVTGNSYSAVYNLYSSSQSISEQLRDARAASELERMRGGY